MPSRTDPFPKLSRRAFLAASGGLIAASPALGAAQSSPRWKSDPFSLGVASGSPSPDGFVLWTRLAPEPENYDPMAPAGMSGGAVPVGYEIAADPNLKTVIRRGTAVADPRYAYAVHAEIPGLSPGRPYWYRFMSGGATSRTGRAITAPAPQSAPQRMKFGFVSCANYEHGYFAAYRHLAEEQPDLVLFLGDYIYEYVDTRSTNLVRTHSQKAEAETLPAYRARYAQYRLDPDLQRLHAETTAIMTWDDHEVQNDYANQASQTFDEPAKFLSRRAAGYQAFYEHMPLRAGSRPSGAMMRLYDRYRFGDLLEIAVLDGRQYRWREACYAPPNHGGGHLETNAGCPERLDPERSMLGAAQEDWLYDGLARSSARWNLIAQDMMMSELRQKTDAGENAFWTEDWNGYPANRDRLLRHVSEARVANPVVIGGDIHSFWANDLKRDFADPGSPVVATEFVGTSVSAHGPDYDLFARYLPDNPHVRFFDSRVHGYVSVSLERDRMTTRFQAVSDATDPKAGVSTLKSFVVESGRTGAQPV
jgi:alkaline phosphatase D